MARRVAVVTGSNKGIGFAIVRALCKQFDGDVILTARDEGRGQAAVKALQGEGLQPKFQPLDIDDHNSVIRLRDFLQQTYDGLDILVNNAAILFHDESLPYGKRAKEVIKTNYFSNLDVCNVLFPILRPHARVVNLSSVMSQIGLNGCSEALRARFTDPTISIEELSSLMQRFVDLSQDGKQDEAGYFSSYHGYAMSKIGVTVMSMIQQRELDKAGAEDIVVNACCPGYVDTDMSEHKGFLTIDQGAESPIYCALLPPNVSSPRGKFISQKNIVEWKM
ncbi:carbonyl reductase [NADPH] 1 [Biomphalaria pfeifferi]|uniref:carbonyl reductase (NADPH) n=1 Tax=Biomphalaria pfeifferi TaxID=112525 RepID=A0AAD8F0M1_BIOPF|nr:carbonyl reductase [NADPH] 1 [Biomphalaria pfeifferi]